MVLIPNSALGVLVGDDSSELISLIPGQLAGFPQGVLVLGGNDTVQGAVDSELINGNQGFDQIFGGGGNDNLFGGQEDDLLDGGVGDDILFGNLGADIITGGDGNDNLFGGKDNDNLSGDLGNDILSGDFGIDALTGGGGSDIFVLGIGGGGADIITDFQDGADLMQLPAGFTFSNILVQASGNQTAIALATTGEELVRLNGIQPSVITSADFVGGSPTPVPQGEPGSNIATALDLGAIPDLLNYSQFVGKDDPNDFYRFTLQNNSDFSLVLGALSQGTYVYLIKDFNNNNQVDEGDGDVLDDAYGYSSSNGEINRALEAGTYYIRVSNDSGTNYDLRLEAASKPATTPSNPGNTLNTALDLGSLSQNINFTDFVGEGDQTDIYRFTLNNNSDVELIVGAVSQGTYVYLMKDYNNNNQVDEGDGDVLDDAYGYSSSNAEITQALEAGTYYIEVSSNAATNYDLRVNVIPG
ncbi:pre-peptidase C-terminal domain-containing protein [Planktothrix mougeotii]|uniref:Pre-peptidase C-terminal domain-containing protein n=1 Tax=Planktothrix mougeotii LEGE 06226 TaxID=1828728 RepID=A0ABR9UE99_9CYAN|nr:pre-peptidase C-terminal domain-containing protein [Planktothrix mougeotii]MBE9143909.1 pre-peptidase C-terminal domain-containing protein [Planktothrix mougeotii LEGE 06226]